MVREDLLALDAKHVVRQIPATHVLAAELARLGPCGVPAQRLHVESDRGAVAALPLLRFPGPLPGPLPVPGVPVTRHRAVHKPRVYSGRLPHVVAAHGEGMAVPRYRYSAWWAPSPG